MAVDGFSSGCRSSFHWLVATLAVVAVMLAPRPAEAQRELLTPLGGKGQLAIDQISGLRVGVSAYGPSVNYYGPLGLAVQNYSQADPGVANGTDTIHLTTVWIAPSLDFFVIDHLSVGGLLVFASTSGSIDTPQMGNPNVTNSASIPTLQTFELLPRVGWMVALSDRWGIWPRGSIGYVSQGVSPAAGGAGPGSNASDTVHGLVLDIDVGFLFRVNETFFLRAAPELGWLPSGSHSFTDAANRTTSYDAHYVQFTLTAGIGVLLDL
jgi:hypothetical protein